MPNISRQLRIHIEEPNDIAEPNDIKNNPNSHNDIRPISNRNIIHKLNSMNSSFKEEPPIIKKTISPKINYNYKSIQIYTQYILNSGYTQGTILCVTTWAIFGDDIRYLFLSPLTDYIFSIINWIIMSIFIAEYILTIFNEPKYIYTVFSALDILSIVSMIPMENIADFAQNIIFFNADGGTVARTGRAAKVGAKAGRIVKAARFLRLGRLVMEAMDTKESQEDNKQIKRSESLDERPANSLSHRLSKELTVKVVIIIFLLLVVYPFLGIHAEHFEKRTTQLQLINDGCTQCSDNSFFNSMIDNVIQDQELYYLNACGKEYLSYTNTNPKRLSWISLYSESYLYKELSIKTQNSIRYDICKDVYGINYDTSCSHSILTKINTPISNITAAYYDNTLYQKEALMSLYFLVFVLGLLVFSSFIISKDTDKISRLISDPLNDICKKMKLMQEFKFDKQEEDEKSEIHEINELTDSFRRLQNAIVSFSRYVPIPIVKNLMKSKKEASINVERRIISIFFSDIKSFTTICEQLKPSEILTLLTEYFDAMEEIVSDTQGTILEYVGDAILAVWNAPTEISDHAEQSIACALKMQLKLAKLRLDWKKKGFPDVFIRVGVNTGEVFHGNIGSHKRLKYGVLGDSVNLASRLEELNKRYGTELLVTNDTYKTNNVSKLFIARPVDLVVVKGKTVPTLLWEIVGIYEDADSLAIRICELQKVAMNTFLEQEFKECVKLYEEAFILESQHKQKYQQLSHDIRFMYNTTEHIYNRAKLLLGSPKVENWDGSETLSEKHF